MAAWPRCPIAACLVSRCQRPCIAQLAGRLHSEMEHSALTCLVGAFIAPMHGESGSMYDGVYCDHAGRMLLTEQHAGSPQP